MRRLFVLIIISLVGTACSGGDTATTTTSLVPHLDSTAAPTTTLPPVTSPPTTSPPTSAPAVRDEVRATVNVEVDGRERRYDLFIPGGFPDVPTPLVIDMHGALSSPSDHERLSGMQVKAAEEGFVVAQPAGILRSWDILTGNGEDVDFILAVVADVQSQVAIDPDRIYATGMSNGGGMADRLGCVAPDVFAAIAPVAGWFVDAVDCSSDRRIPVLAFHGTADIVVPYDGGPFFVAIEEWAAEWAERNGCSPTPVDKQAHDDVTVRVWVDCDAIVELYTIDGGGHGWPGTEFELGKLVTTSSIDATDVIWEFFVNNPRT